MSSPTPSPPSLHSGQDESRDSSSSDFSNAVIVKYDLQNTLSPSQKEIISHGVENILSDGAIYPVNENTFVDCKADVLSTIPNSFVQDYNSRDSVGFTIHDILGLHQSYNPVSTQDDLEQRYDYQIPNYDNISNSSNNYGSGTEEVITKGCINKNDIFNHTTTQDVNQTIYNRLYEINEPVRYHERSGLNDVKDPVEINDLHESSFPSQVNTLHRK